MVEWKHSPNGSSSSRQSLRHLSSSNPRGSSGIAAAASAPLSQGRKQRRRHPGPQFAGGQRVRRGNLPLPVVGFDLNIRIMPCLRCVRHLREQWQRLALNSPLKPTASVHTRVPASSTRLATPQPLLVRPVIVMYRRLSTAWHQTQSWCARYRAPTSIAARVVFLAPVYRRLRWATPWG